MVLFQSNREFNAKEELSDALTEEEYIAALKTQVKAHHLHNDGSVVTLEVMKGRIERDIKEDFFEEKKTSPKAIVFSCNCGRDLLAEQKKSKLNIATYLPSPSSGYTVNESSAVSYGGK